MGVIKILSNLTNGQYSVELVKDTERAIKKKKELTDFITTKETLLTQFKNTALQLSTTKRNALITLIDSTIADQNTTLAYKDKEIKRIEGELEKQNIIHNQHLAFVVILETLIADKKNFLAVFGKVTGVAETKNMWLADFSEDLIIGSFYPTADIIREKGLSVIQPQTYTPDIVYTTEQEDLVGAIEGSIANLSTELSDKKTELNILHNQLSVAQKVVDSAPLTSTEFYNRVEDLKVQLYNQSFLQHEISLIKDEIDKANKLLAVEQLLLTEINTARKLPSGVFARLVNKYTKRLQPVMSSGAYAVFFNKAILPGLQRWKPTYRIGTISSIDYSLDTCSITLLSSPSSQLNLTTGEKKTNPNNYINVTIRYGRCNSIVFEVLDSVIVYFHLHWDNPQVIGFSSNPKPCTSAFCSFLESTGTDNTTGVKYLVNSDGNLINGSPVSNNVAAIDWNNGSQIVTWSGPHGRSLGPFEIFIDYSQSGSATDAYSINYHHKTSTNLTIPVTGNKLGSITTVSRWENVFYYNEVAFTAPDKVLAAWVYDNRFVCVVFFQPSGDFTDIPSISEMGKTYIYISDWVITDPVPTTWTLLHTETHVNNEFDIPLGRRSPTTVNTAGNRLIIHSRRGKVVNYQIEKPLQTNGNNGLFENYFLTQNLFYEYTLQGTIGNYNIALVAESSHDTFTDGTIGLVEKIKPFEYKQLVSENPDVYNQYTSGAIESLTHGSSLERVEYPLFKDWRVVNGIDVIQTLSFSSERTTSGQVLEFFPVRHSGNIYSRDISKNATDFKLTTSGEGKISYKVNGETIFSDTPKSSGAEISVTFTENVQTHAVNCSRYDYTSTVRPLFIDLRYNTLISCVSERSTATSIKWKNNHLSYSQRIFSDNFSETTKYTLHKDAIDTLIHEIVTTAPPIEDGNASKINTFSNNSIYHDWGGIFSTRNAFHDTGLLPIVGTGEISYADLLYFWHSSHGILGGPTTAPYDDLVAAAAGNFFNILETNEAEGAVQSEFPAVIFTDGTPGIVYAAVDFNGNLMGQLYIKNDKLIEGFPINFFNTNIAKDLTDDLYTQAGLTAYTGKKQLHANYTGLFTPGFDKGHCLIG